MSSSGISPSSSSSSSVGSGPKSIMNASNGRVASIISCMYDFLIYGLQVIVKILIGWVNIEWRGKCIVTS